MYLHYYVKGFEKRGNFAHKWIYGRASLTSVILTLCFYNTHFAKRPTESELYNAPQQYKD